MKASGIPFVGWAALAALSTPALGVSHSAPASVECTGTVTLTGVESAHYSPEGAFVLRNGAPSSEYSAAYFTAKLTPSSAGCAKLATQYAWNLAEISVSGLKTLGASSQAETEAQAEALIGTEGPFVVEQSLGYQAEDGSLPFYPLLYGETLTVKSPLLTLQALLQVDTLKTYGIPAPQYLPEADKVALTQKIFAYLEAPAAEQGLKNWLAYPLIAAHPTFEADFAAYVPKLLALYQTAKTGPDDNLSTGIGSGINHLTHLFPETYQLNIVEILAENPSLLALSGGFAAFETCPHVTAQQLDTLLAKLAETYGGTSAAAKAEWAPVLAAIAGGWSGGASCVGDITSTYAKGVAAGLMKGGI